MFGIRVLWPDMWVTRAPGTTAASGGGRRAESVELSGFRRALRAFGLWGGRGSPIPGAGGRVVGASSGGGGRRPRFGLPSGRGRTWGAVVRIRWRYRPLPGRRWLPRGCCGRCRKGEGEAGGRPNALVRVVAI